MALFDRRLLAFFDDSGGGATLMDQLVDNQLALAELDQEMYKCQQRIGGIQGKRPRDRSAWIKESRNAQSALERYGQAPAVVEVYQGDSDGSDHMSPISPGQRRPSKRGSVANGANRPRRSRRESVRGDSRLSNASRVDESSPVTHFEPDSRVDTHAAIPSYNPGVTWVQIDTAYGLPRRGGKLGRFVVEATWQGQRKGQLTEPRWQGQNQSGHGKVPDDERDCIFRQQLKLDPSPGSNFNHRYVVVNVHRQDPEENIGYCKLDVLDEHVREVQVYNLLDEHGNRSDATLKVRLSMPSGPRPSVVDTAAHESAPAQPVRRPSAVAPTEKAQERRLSASSSSGRPHASSDLGVANARRSSRVEQPSVGVSETARPTSKPPAPDIASQGVKPAELPLEQPSSGPSGLKVDSQIAEAAMTEAKVATPAASSAAGPAASSRALTPPVASSDKQAPPAKAGSDAAKIAGAAAVGAAAGGVAGVAAGVAGSKVAGTKSKASAEDPAAASKAAAKAAQPPASGKVAVEEPAADQEGEAEESEEEQEEEEEEEELEQSEEEDTNNNA